MKDLNNVSTFWKTNLDGKVYLSLGERLFFPQLVKVAQSSERILEVGVGRGRMVSLLKNTGVMAEFYGLDITDNVTQSGTIGKIGDARALPYSDNAFDLVYSLGVVEHFPETELAIKEHVRVAKKGAYVLVTTPHASVFTIPRYCIYFFKERSMGSFEEIRGRNIQLRTMKKYFHRTGEVEIVEAGTYGLMGGRTLLQRLGLGEAPSWMERLERHPAIGAYLYVLARKL